MSNVCEALHIAIRAQTRFRFPFHAELVPRNGIYCLFESGELSHGGDRIVRVGTHTGQNQLRSRLKQHFLLEKKDLSIFRKNIGRALLSRKRDPYLHAWELDQTTKVARERNADFVDLERQREIEREVSCYIQAHFTFTIIEVPSKERRLWLESRLVSTLSHCEQCVPSPEWLGLHSPKTKIRESGLWQVNELYKEPLREDELSSLFARTSESQDETAMPPVSDIPPESLAAIQQHFHALIRQRAGDLVEQARLPLPLLTQRFDVRSKQWLAIPGMYGGFAYWFEGEKENSKLICESWCRVVGGSGQRHEVTPHGSKLLDKGFV